MKKTNAMRILDAAKINYKILEYEVDEADLSGIHVAQVLRQDPNSVFKTLVLKGEKLDYLVCCIPVAEELDLKKVAKIAKDKKVEMLPMKELFGLTGYIRGGCTSIGMKKKFPTYFDETASLFDEIAISAGVRGAQLLINPEDLMPLIQATYADLTAQTSSVFNCH